MQGCGRTAKTADGLEMTDTEIIGRRWIPRLLSLLAFCPAITGAARAAESAIRAGFRAAEPAAAGLVLPRHPLRLAHLPEREPDGPRSLDRHRRDLR